MPFAELKNLLLIPAIIAWIRIPFPQKRWVLAFGLMVLASALTELLAISGVQINGNTLPIYNSYLITEHIAITYMFAVYPYRFRFQKPLAYFSCGLMVILMIIFGVRVGFSSGFNSQGLVIGSFFLVVQSLSSMYKLASNTDKLIYRGDFWILSSILVYFLCAMPIMGIFQYLDNDLSNRIYAANDPLFALRYILVIIGFILLAKSKKA